MAARVHYLSDNVIEVRELKSDVTGVAINDATITVTVVDDAEQEVGGQVWPLTLLYVADSNGYYRGTIQSTATLTKNESYTAQITINGGAGLAAYLEKPFRVVVRDA